MHMNENTKKAILKDFLSSFNKFISKILQKLLGKPKTNQPNVLLKYNKLIETMLLNFVFKMHTLTVIQGGSQKVIYAIEFFIMIILQTL